MQFVDKNAVGKTIGRSGNGGYIVGLPLLLGEKDPDNSNALLVYQGGFVGTGAN